MSEDNNNNNNKRHILILGGGFAGVEVLKNLQKKYNDDNKTEITLVSQNNFLLFTPMLPEIVSGTIESRHIVTPIRSFCKSAKFYEAEVKAVELDKKQVVITHQLGKCEKCPDYHHKATEKMIGHDHVLSYDYLVIALGSEDNFFGNKNIEKNAFTLKTINDAIVLRNHIIKTLEQAVLEQNDTNLRKALLTFVVVGGGFSGVETVGAINDFVRESIKKYYPSLYMSDVKVILVSGTDKILEQIDENLGRFALAELKNSGVEFIGTTTVKDVTEGGALLENGDLIPSFSVVWAAGVTPNKLISNLKCEHDRKNRIIVNSFLEIKGYEDIVYALGDCSSITNPHTGKPYPPTAQHAIRQSKVVSINIISSVRRQIKGQTLKEKKEFDYKTKGMMAEIGKRSGVAILFGKIKIHGFLAWWLWRLYYLSNLPTTKKKLKVLGDWIFDLIYKPDVSQIQ